MSKVYSSYSSCRVRRPYVFFIFFFTVSDLIFPATMAEKVQFDCATYVPKEKALTDSEIDALEIYPEPPEDVESGIPYRGYIYVLREEKDGQATGLHKVGRSENPSQRRQNLQSGNYRYLNLVNMYLVKDMVRAEAAARHELRHYHEWMHGGGTEWYGVKSNQELAFYHDLTQAIARYRE